MKIKSALRLRPEDFLLPIENRVALTIALAENNKVYIISGYEKAYKETGGHVSLRDVTISDLNLVDLKDCYAKTIYDKS